MKLIIVFGSTMGNTETLSQYVEEGLKGNGVDITVKRVEKTKPEELRDYDGILLGCSTWGDGELQDDFISFEEELKKVDLSGKKAACFGPGETSYPQFCKAVDILENTLKSAGVEIISKSLKIDGDIDPVREEAQIWGANIRKTITEG